VKTPAPRHSEQYKRAVEDLPWEAVPRRIGGRYARTTWDVKVIDRPFRVVMDVSEYLADLLVREHDECLEGRKP
jgi:hypothetical protein